MQKVATLLLMSGLFSLNGSTVQAQVINNITFTLTAVVQSYSTDKGTTTATPAPKKASITNKQILSQLALDEYIDGNWGSTTFPSGAKLVEVDGSFQVLDKNNNLLVDVSNIITLSTGNNYISAGKVDDSSGLASPSTTVTQILFLTFDDTHIGGDIQFTIGGLATITTNDTKPNGYGLYTEKTSYKASAVAGEGTAKGASIVISGTVSASGKGTLSL